MSMTGRRLSCYDTTLVDQKSFIGSVDEEITDILIFLCSIANRLDIDMEQAFRDKEVLNHRRTWQKST